MSDRLRVVIAEDHYLVREGIRQSLEAAADIDVVAAVGDATELEATALSEAPDVVVTDIRMPPGHGMEGIDSAHRIREVNPRIGVVVLSQYADASYALALFRSGTAGLAYLLKERIGDPEQLIVAVREVASGGSIIDPDVVTQLVAQTSRGESSLLRTLSERELDVLHAMARGRTNAGIADELHLSESSVEKYSTAIFAKLGLNEEPGVHRRVAAVLALLEDEGRAQPLTDG